MQEKYQMMLDRALQSGRRLADEGKPAHEAPRPSDQSVQQEEFKQYAAKQTEYLKGRELSSKVLDKKHSKDNLMPIQQTPTKGLKKPVAKKSQVKLVFGKREPDEGLSTQREHPASTTKKLNTSYSNHGSEEIAMKTNKGTRFVSGQKTPATSNRGSRVGTPSRNKKQMLSVQEEFYKYSQRGETPQSSKSYKSIPPMETLDIYKKYGFLKSGNIKISQKTAKFICSRIRPTDCLLHSLDALFLALGDDRLYLESKARFQGYKDQLSNLSIINSKLKALYSNLKSEPDQHARDLTQANQYLEKFYADSIFSDLITVDYCKEIAWIVQGLVRYQQKNQENTANNTQIDQSEYSVEDQSLANNYDRLEHQRANSIDHFHLDGNLTNTHEIVGGENDRVAQFSYQEDIDQGYDNPYMSENIDEYQDKEDIPEPKSQKLNPTHITLAPPLYMEERDFVSFGRNDSGYVSMTSNHDQSPEANLKKDSISNVIDRHKEKVQEMMRQMYLQQENHLGYEDELYEKEEKAIQIENWGKDSKESMNSGSRDVDTPNESHYRQQRYQYEDDEEPRVLIKESIPVQSIKKPTVDLNHPILESLELARKTFNMKSFIILKSQLAAGPSTTSCLLSLMVLTGDLRIEEVALYSDWRDLRRVLINSKVDAFIPIVFTPKFLLELPEGVIRMAETLLSESQQLANQEMDSHNYYISKLSSFLTLTFEIYYYARRNPDEYSHLYSVLSQASNHN